MHIPFAVWHSLHYDRLSQNCLKSLDIREQIKGRKCREPQPSKLKSTGQLINRRALLQAQTSSNDTLPSRHFFLYHKQHQSLIN